MHSIKKVEEAARKARDEKNKKKMVQIDAVRKKIFSLFRSIEGNEVEFLELTNELLQKMPDLYSFWVMRRQVLESVHEKMKADDTYTIFTKDELERYWRKLDAMQKKEKAEGVEEKEAEQSAPEVKDDQEEQEPTSTTNAAGDQPEPRKPLPTFDEVLDRDIALSEAALFSNPKSYSAWNHRRWLMTVHSSPPLLREISICEKALAVDWRNFHVWDYRRFIVKELGRSLEDELQFAHQMVKKNPSNYSAWHYRINLLLEAGGQISDELFVKEMNDITEVCVVNSEDQTAWTYVNWLVERFFDTSGKQNGADNFVTFTDHPSVSDKFHSTIVFFNAVSLDGVTTFLQTPLANDIQLFPRGQSKASRKWVQAHVWDIYSVRERVAVNAAMLPEGARRREEPLRRYVNLAALDKTFSLAPRSMSAEVAECLQSFLAVCEELMKDNNEANPWEFCAQASLLPLVQGISAPVQERVLEFVEKAKKCDPQRGRLYDALTDRVVLTNFLRESSGKGDVDYLTVLCDSEGQLMVDLHDYSVLLPIAGLIRLRPSPEHRPRADLQAQLAWFITA